MGVVPLWNCYGEERLLVCLFIVCTVHVSFKRADHGGCSSVLLRAVLWNKAGLWWVL